MKFEIVAVGKQRNNHFRQLTDEYIGRLDHYSPVELIEVPQSRQTNHDVDKGLAEEAERLQQATSEGATTVAVDEAGSSLSSRQLARWVDDWMVGGRRYVSFFIGSANGLDNELRRSCDRRLSLSKLTLPHEMARMVLAEQLYRAMSIIRGEPYHR